jgi:hypothetical protein
MPNKTDCHDASALAQIMRAGWYQAVNVTGKASARC